MLNCSRMKNQKPVWIQYHRIYEASSFFWESDESDHLLEGIRFVLLTKKNLSAHKYSTKNLQRKEHFSKNNWMSFGDDFVDPFFEFLCLKKHHQRTHFQFGGKFFCGVTVFESQRAWIKDSNSSTNFSQGFFSWKTWGFFRGWNPNQLPSLKLT